jgi:Mrp family chromosome partitioning ATPase/predicted Fe-Mo cluster-binding NifX family protein
MSENCNQQCNTRSEECEGCNERKENPQTFFEKPHELSNIKKTIAIVSGKGGVGKSMVTSMLAVMMKNQKNRVAILDADVTGPSIPKTFGINQKAVMNETGIFPVKTKTGIEVMSINLLLEHDTDPVVWRGPIISNTVKQFWQNVIWGDIDYMFIDMPPGTGDVPLTVFQSIPINGIIIVTSPQELVSMIVAKALNMAKMMNVPVLGIIENMSYIKCPDCNKEIKLFGESHLEAVAKEHNLKILAKLPVDPLLAEAADNGEIEVFDVAYLDKVAEILKSNGGNKMKIAVASENKMVTEHFGHCENFNIYEIENKQIIKHESIANPGHKPGFLPKFLNEMGVNVIISGGMGGGAVDIFKENNIEVILGATGDAEAAVKNYLEGKLKSTGSICHEHKHEHEGKCGGR